MEKDNVVNLHPKYDSHYRADGSALLTDKLDPVLFNEFVKQKKLLDDLIEGKKLPDGKEEIIRLRYAVVIGWCTAFWFMLKVIVLSSGN